MGSRTFVRGDGAAQRFVELRWEGASYYVRRGRVGDPGAVTVVDRKTPARVEAAIAAEVAKLLADGWQDGEPGPGAPRAPRLVDAQADLGRRIGALGAAPAVEQVFRAFAAWCAEVRYPAVRHDRAWLAFEHVLPPDQPDEPGVKTCAIRLVRELEPLGEREAVEASVTLWFPMTRALRAWLDEPLTHHAWAEPPGRADRLWARFRSTIGPFVEAFSPDVELPDDTET
jgi:hypothetical protein